MRAKNEAQGLAAQAVAGTHVVLIGWDLVDPALERGLLGIAIQRTDHDAQETIWLRGMKAFPGTVLAPEQTASSQDQPFQSFQWGDYTAKPGHGYTYALTAMYGAPSNLRPGASVALDVRTEDEDGGMHSVYFNRGAIASQEYSRRFHGQYPSKVGQAAYDWLSRGLMESILRFIALATDRSFALRVAIYEFQWAAVLEALRDASGRDADVKVLYDAIDNAEGKPVHPNEEAIDAAGIAPLCQGIAHGKIMHNKFIVLLKDGKPIEVLTGSTNYTENGIFGHLNCAHIVRDETIAKAYLDYWQELSGDPELADLRGWSDQATPAPDVPPAAGVGEVFSPQHGTGTLDTYGAIAASAAKALFMTFAFGINDVFVPTYEQTDDVLRFALMDKEGVGRNLAKGKQTVAEIRTHPNAVVAIGQNVTLNAFDRWLKEASGVSAGENVRWVHTKFMLVDPLSNDPIVITGSANFSAASVDTNHENMLVIRGDTRVADIYLGEFMRQFSSYAFRDAAFDATHGDDAQTFRPQDLKSDDSWIDRYRQPGSSGALRRAYFAGR